MTLENQVVSLELAKRLKELGVKQESLFYWYRKDFRNETTQSSAWHIGRSFEAPYDSSNSLSAFTVAELGEMLRPHLKKSIWLADIREAMEQATYMENEADARAKMVCYLLENKLIPL